MTQHSPGVEVTGAARSFGPVHAVRDVSLRAEPGRVTALIGPNGSGKTTLLLMLASLLAPDRGQIRIEGADPVADPRAVRRVMGWMPDVLGSWASLSVRTSLELTGRLYGLDRAAARARALELVQLVDLVPLAEQPSRVLSRGQKQRLSLARALVHDPRVLLLDEPASGLDPAARHALRTLMRRLADEGRTIIVSSHVLAELDEMADDAVFMEAGVTVSAERIAAAKTVRREWRVRSRQPEALRGALEAAGVAAPDVRDDGPGLLVSVAGDEGASELLASLVRAGVPVVAFAPAVGDLEHTFLDLSTRREGAGS
ncbi:ABC transporter ATP-binding protein [Homoserinibacter sp. YIM 151385]|uniref:ABC transporter ATP-binding protein n=1 Tax=Homoserinibacter sp. YIM 151385 TaxID=2985506 RepID=UPI0022F0E01F|nr:ABC transporter ATP-binding protein [Homoserinibacter sp. YIM 151385]WBU38041.1 ABC transporter ATP-binding protein [Homoserinibacter sp. YIM 151385]